MVTAHAALYANESLLVCASVCLEVGTLMYYGFTPKRIILFFKYEGYHRGQHTYFRADRRDETVAATRYRFSCFRPDDRRVSLQWDALSPLIVAPFHGGSGPPSNK